MKMADHTRRWGLPIGVAALAFALTACGPGSTTAQSKDSAKQSDPAAGDVAPSKGAAAICKLLSQAEAQGAISEPVATGVSTSGQTAAGLSGGCKYLGTTVNAKTHTKGIVQVLILGTKLTRVQYDELATSEGKVGADAAAKAVPGLGETAFYVPGLVTLFDHGLALAVQVVRSDRVPLDAVVITKLAHTALDRAADLR
ncbi:MAG: hypothetical protein WCB04_02185 [Mycobacteriales bacterium]